MNIFKQIASGQASKALVSLATAATTWLAANYGHAAWEPLVTTLIGAALVYLVPNAAPAAATKSDPPQQLP